MNIKKTVVALTLALSLFSVSAYAKTMQFTMGDYQAKVDDGEITSYEMEVAPYTVEGRTMVPVRILTEAFGADVQYIEDENKVVVTLDDKVINFVIGEAKATVNGEVVALDVPTVETNGRTLIPLRFVSENLGFDVEYLPSKEQILITNDPAVVEFRGAKISLQDFKALYTLNLINYPSNSEEELVEYTKNMLIQFAIYESEADKLGLPLDPSYYEQVKATVDRFSSLNMVLDASITGLYEMNYRASYLTNFLKLLYTPSDEQIEEFYNSNYYNAKHILISDKATANKVLSMIKRGTDFDKLMAEYTEDGSLAEYPDGYLFATGEMIAEFENAVKDLKVNKVSGLVQSDFGYHIIKRLPLPEYTAEIKDTVASAYANVKVAEYYENIANTNEINISAYTNEQLMELCK